MGYFINQKIASVNPLQQITLANNPHFIQFSSLKESAGDKKSIELFVSTMNMPETDANINVNFTETESGETHFFVGTYDRNKVNKTTFLIIRAGDQINESKEIANFITASSQTAQNLHTCLMRDPFLKNNFEIMLALNADHHGNVKSRSKINIVAKGIGSKYDLNISKISPVGFINSNSKTPEASSYDTIDYNTGNYAIELDVYTDTGVFLGANDLLLDSRRGKYLTTLSKAYHEKKIWFDLNSLFSKRMSYSDSFMDAKS